MPPEEKRLDKSKNARCGPFVLIILHLNVKDLSSNKTCVLSQLATRHKTFVILLEEHQCTNADQLIIPYFPGWLGLKQEAWPCHVSPREIYGCPRFARLSMSTNRQPRTSH